jgi:hypothetical protein
MDIDILRNRVQFLHPQHRARTSLVQNLSQELREAVPGTYQQRAGKKNTGKKQKTNRKKYPRLLEHARHTNRHRADVSGMSESKLKYRIA